MARSFSRAITILAVLALVLGACAGTTTPSGGGTSGDAYRVLSSTNLTLPLSNWSQVSSGTFRAGGVSSATLPFTAAGPGRFYVIAVP